MAIIDLPDRSKEGLKIFQLKIRPYPVKFGQFWSTETNMTGHFSTQNQKKSMSLMWSSCNQSALTMILNVKMSLKSSLLKMKVRTISLHKTQVWIHQFSERNKTSLGIGKATGISTCRRKLPKEKFVLNKPRNRPNLRIISSRNFRPYASSEYLSIAMILLCAYSIIWILQSLPIVENEELKSTVSSEHIYEEIDNFFGEK